MSQKVLYFVQATPDAKLPTRGTAHSVGYDLYCDAEVTVTGGQGVTLVSTGVCVKLPVGYYGRIAMRSGLAIREHLAVSAGVIDRDYSGVVGVAIYCTKIGHTCTIKKGERFAQFIAEACYTAPSNEEEEIKNEKLVQVNEEMAGHTGYGSTGKF